MRRHRSSPYAKSATSPLSESVSLIRTFNSETNPARPVRPSPLTRSAIRDMPLDMLDRIRSFPLFQSAPESFLAAIGSRLKPQLHSPHDYILTEGDEAKAMYWLVRGAVAVTSRDGESTYAELKPGALFGEIGILMNIPRTATIIARTKCLLVVLTKEDLEQELPNFPDVHRAIHEEALERLSILRRKKQQESSADDYALASEGRGEKRTHEDDDGDTTMHDSYAKRPNGVASNKKRKSPSPGLVEAAATSALGTGMVNVRQLLRELPLFSSLPSDMLHFLGSNAQQCTYPPFTDIIKQDSKGREVFFIVRGEVEVVDEKLQDAAGKKITRGPQVKARLKEGNYFGEVASLSLAPRRTATVRSVTSVECLQITGEVLAEFWKRCPTRIREQIESTAKERLHSANENDVVMLDSTNSEPRISELAIAERLPKLSSGQTLPIVVLDRSKSETTHKPKRLDSIPVIEPIDPDPYSNAYLDNVRSRSRRSSLAPVLSEAPAEHGGKRSPLVTGQPLEVKPGRPKLISRASQFGRGALPKNALVHVLLHLELHDLLRFRAVSKYWAQLLRECPALFRRLDLTKYNKRVTDQVIIKQVGPFVGRRPRFIDVSNCFHITDEGFAALATMCGANVVSWHMKSVWDVSASAIHEMVKQAKALEDIDLSNCRKVNDALLMHVIGNVPLPAALMGNRVQSNHRHYPGRPAPPVPPNQQSGIIIGAQRLRKITLSYCKHITDRSMAHIGLYARTRLEEVNFTRCTTISDQGFEAWGQYHFPRLTKLCLADCTYLTDNAIVFLTNAAPSLRSLDLSFCCALSDTATEVIAIGCPQLVQLSLSFCGSAVSDSSLRSIGLHLLQLRFLSVRGCVRVTGVGVEAVVEGCHRLQAFDVSQCKNLGPWLECGGLRRVRKGVVFNLVAGGWTGSVMG